LFYKTLLSLNYDEIQLTSKLNIYGDTP
jgi:hypothetical protein